MIAAYEHPSFDVDSDTRDLIVRFRLINRSHEEWRSSDGFAIGWQIYDPDTATFIREGEWNALDQDLMATYFFVFGIVLKSRFGADQSKTGFAFYFLAGMLPWLAFSEAIGRAPTGILENRVLVKKVVFPLEIVPVIHVISGLVTQAFATAIFVGALLILRGNVPPTVAWLPVLLIPSCSWQAMRGSISCGKASRM
jgi:hypothetical protein